MKVQPSTITVDDDFRRALAHRLGEHGAKASYDDVKAHADAYGLSIDDDVFYEWRECQEGCEAPE